jgi:hypothetical protein
VKLLNSSSEVVILGLITNKQTRTTKKPNFCLSSSPYQIVKEKSTQEERNAVHAGWTPLISATSENLYSSCCDFCYFSQGAKRLNREHCRSEMAATWGSPSGPLNGYLCDAILATRTFAGWK